MHSIKHSLSLLPLLLLIAGSCQPPTPDSVRLLPSPNSTLEYIDPSLPPLLPAQNPKCSLHVLAHDFHGAPGASPAAANYTPPRGCPAPWSRVVLELSAVATDVQKDRTAAVWLDGAEILRTTTPLPMSPGVFWRVRKDVTRYTALLRDSGDEAGIISMMMDGSDVELPGVYSVNVSLHFYRGALCGVGSCGVGSSGIHAHPTIKGLYREPADLIIPVSKLDGSDGGFWFTVRNETEVQTALMVIPNNTYRAVLEMYVSHHGDDEYWYVNPLRTNGLHGLGADEISSAKANGGFRQVVATVDGRYVGSAVPFPVVYPSSINPYFWAPVAAIGAYDHPSYDVDLTPFVGELIDGSSHEFGLTVKDCQPHWLVSANLHLWVDAWSDAVEAGLVRYKVPPLRLSRQADWKNLDGKSEVEGQVIIRFSGWVSSSKGNITTSVRHKIKFKSHVEVEDNGTTKTVELESKARTSVRIEQDDVVIGRVIVDTESPLQLASTWSNSGGGSRFRRSKLTHGLTEARSVTEGKSAAFSTVADRQESEGSVLVEDGVSVWGKGDTKSTYKFRDDRACYLRTVNMVGGKVKEDVETASCAMAAAE